nr:unnamed protein product [Callosobruchus chinensis]
MDLQSVLLCPESNACALYYKTKLIVHSFTIYDIKRNQGYCYLWYESEGGLTSNEFTSIIIHSLKGHLERYGLKNSSSVEITLWSDGCGYQNRSTTLSNGLFNFALENGVTVMQKYLQKGHTQMEVDRWTQMILHTGAPVERVRVRTGKRFGKRKASLKYCFTVNDRKIDVYRTFFLNTLNISQTYVRFDRKKRQSSGVVTPDQTGRHEPSNKINQEIKNRIREHIQKFSGHTHLEVDTVHARIERQIKSTPQFSIITSWDWQQLIKPLIHPRACWVSTSWK